VSPWRGTCRRACIRGPIPTPIDTHRRRRDEFALDGREFSTAAEVAFDFPHHSIEEPGGPDCLVKRQ
jgi:hypothetical protein